jgi:hypothetical protein
MGAGGIGRSGKGIALRIGERTGERESSKSDIAGLRGWVRCHTWTGKIVLWS